MIREDAKVYLGTQAIGNSGEQAEALRIRLKLMENAAAAIRELDPRRHAIEFEVSIATRSPAHTEEWTTSLALRRLVQP